jgi:hypothetical protein
LVAAVADVVAADEAAILVDDGSLSDAVATILQVSATSATGRGQATTTTQWRNGVSVSGPNKAAVDRWKNHVVITSGNQIVVVDVSGVTVTNTGRSRTG